MNACFTEMQMQRIDIKHNYLFSREHMNNIYRNYYFSIICNAVKITTTKNSNIFRVFVL